jgi:hypothetical protein
MIVKYTIDRDYKYMGEGVKITYSNITSKYFNSSNIAVPQLAIVTFNRFLSIFEWLGYKRFKENCLVKWCEFNIVNLKTYLYFWDYKNANFYLQDAEEIINFHALYVSLINQSIFLATKDYTSIPHGIIFHVDENSLVIISGSYLTDFLGAQLCKVCGYSLEDRFWMYCYNSVYEFYRSCEIAKYL